MNLTNYVRQVSSEDFGKEFRHEAVWNTRLRSTGGRFFPKDGHLDFNFKIYERFGLETFRKIVRHELCHYHLYFEKKGYRHRDQDFKNLLKKVDGLRYAPGFDYRSTFLIYKCQQYHMFYSRKKQINPKRYCCGKCQGKLKFIRQQQF